MLADLRAALVITRREVYDQFRDWRIIFPVIALTLIFPWVMNFTAGQLVNFVQGYGAPLIGERLIPFLLMMVGFFPSSISLVIGLESFVGEKERHSIEPLLSSPLSDGQLYLGKLLAAMAPPLLGSYLGIIVYLIGIYYRIGWQPPLFLLIQILVMTTVQAVLMVSGAVVVSSQTTSVRAANLLASFILIPMAFLIQGESVIMFWGIYDVLWWAILSQLIITGLLIRTGVAYFNREEMLGRELDTLNLHWGWHTFKNAFLNEAVSLFDWYRRLIGEKLPRLGWPILFMFLALLAGMWAGASKAPQFILPAELIRLDKINQGFIQGLDSLRFFSPSGISVIFFHNLRAILLATLLGIFSFGVLGVIILMLPFMFIGYIMGNLALAGLSPGLFFIALVLPHGLLEIPAITLAGAAIIALGATLSTPAEGRRTIGEAFLRSLGDWARIMVGLVLPLLLAAALVEVLITPRLAVWLLTGG